MPSTTLFAYLLLLLPTLAVSHSSQVGSLRVEPLSSFLNDLTALQARINYTFEDVHFLGMAMTHASFSGENNKALAILGSKVTEGSMVLNLLDTNLDITAKDLNRRISEFSNEASCAVNGMRLALDKVIRVSAKTNSTAPAVVCGAFRAIFGAVVLDSKSFDVGGRVFTGISDRIGMSMAM